MKKLALARFLLAILSVFPKRHSLISSHPKNVEPFFIFGSGRNGSTLLNLMLNQHSKIFLPPEQYFLGNSIIKYQLYNYILWRDLVKIIYGELIKETGGHSWDFSPNKIISQAISLHRKDRTLQSLIHHIYESYARESKPKAMVWGDSTPYNTRYMNDIYKSFPKAKYIFLVRDGRDVVAAYKKAGASIGQHLSNPENSARHWVKSVRKYIWLTNKTNVHLIKYEDLVTNPEQSMKKILDFLGFEYEDQILRFYENVPNIPEYDEKHHKNLYRPIQTTSIGQWREHLSDGEKECILPILEPYMEKFNYLLS